MSLVLALAGCEAILRLFPEFQVAAGEGEYIFCGTQTARHQRDPIVGYKEIPGNSYFERFSRADPWNYVHINTQGFRSNAARDGEQVIVLGDSMVRGSLVMEHQTFSHRLGQWNDGLSFRNYGTGGYGQANTVRLYEDIAPTIPHRLVIQALSLSTDLKDNRERAVMTNSGVRITIGDEEGSEKPASLPLKIHLFLWKYSKLYALTYSSVLAPLRERRGEAEITRDLEITVRLLERLASNAAAHDATLLLLILPGWAEMAGRDDGMAPDQVRVSILELARSRPDIAVLDVSDRIGDEDPSTTYGKLDKHLNDFGHFIVARELHSWLATHFPELSSAGSANPRFVASPSAEPDCSRQHEYRAMISHNAPLN